MKERNTEDKQDIGMNEQRNTHMRDALCSVLTTFLIVLADFGGTLSHVLRESMA